MKIRKCGEKYSRMKSSRVVRKEKKGKRYLIENFKISHFNCRLAEMRTVTHDA